MFFIITVSYIIAGIINIVGQKIIFLKINFFDMFLSKSKSRLYNNKQEKKPVTALFLPKLDYMTINILEKIRVA